MPRQSSVSRDVLGLRAPKARGTEPSAWEDNLQPGHEKTRSVLWIFMTETSFRAAD